MAAVYEPILRRMEAAGWGTPRTRIRVNKPALLFTVLRLSLFR
jgi:phytoene synthase